MQKAKSTLTTFEVILWQYSANAEGWHPVKLRVTHARKNKYYSVEHDGKKLFMSVEAWQEIQNQEIKVRGDKKKIREDIALAATRAKAAIEKTTSNNHPFTWDKFEKEFQIKDSAKGFLAIFNDELERLRAANRIGTYRTYLNAYNALKEHRKERDFSPFDLTPAMLDGFHEFLKERGCGLTTTGIYARTLKVIYNIAADDAPGLLERYPFARDQKDRKKYKIRTGAGHKGDVLTIEQLQKFIAIETDPESREHEAKLLWLFSFHCHGMNMKDICQLQYRDIQGETIRYIRSKTKDTEKAQEQIEIPLTDRIREIIRSIGNPDKRPTSYVFTVIPNGLASTVKRRTEKEKSVSERIDEIIRQKIKIVNERLKDLCENNKLKGISLTTYWARHTFASLIKDSGESVDTIRQLLGHSDVRTTQAYLKRLDKSKKNEINAKIESMLQAS